ncbi:NPR2 [Branchiostoma lanceolatum]|uniref:NPR2 protein n=1 Tax=Branchiostoma lanceolatum TaxID=7740 RepID=A0A8K0ABT9_BRALA|nr:NPR2 [Branchiostoma lanceolatum]
MRSHQFVPADGIFTNEMQVRDREALSKRGKCWSIFSILALAAVPIVGMLVQSSLIVHDTKREKDSAELVSGEISLGTDMGLIAVSLAVERGTTVLYVGSGNNPRVYDRLKETYRTTDEAIASLTKWSDVPGDSPWQFRSGKNLYEYVREHRQELLSNKTSVEEQIQFYTDINTFLISHLGQTVRKADTSHLWMNVIAYHMIILSQEYAGLERALGSVFFAKGRLLTEEASMYNEVKFYAMSYFEVALKYSADIADIFDDQFRSSTLEKTLTAQRQEIQINHMTHPTADAGMQWFDNMTSYISILQNMELLLSKKILSDLHSQVEDGSTRVIMNAIILVTMMVVSPPIVYGVYKMASDIQSTACRLKDLTQELEHDREKADILLGQIFPKCIANQMKENNAVPAKYFGKVTVMFSSIVGFADISAMMSPRLVVDVLNRLYHIFDSVIDDYDVTKVESTGGVYQVVSGLPSTNGDRHADEIASLALRFLAVGKNFNPLLVSCKIRLRIGVHTGPCVAGVVGYNRPRYYVFGHTVNIAQKLEATSEANRIQVSCQAMRTLTSRGGFTVTPRTDTPLAIKDLMPDIYKGTYWLISQQQPSQPAEEKRNIFAV